MPTSTTTPATTQSGDSAPTVAGRVLRGALICLLPCLVALLVAGTSWGGGLIPWGPRQADLDVYLQAARALGAGDDPYQLPGDLPFLYPPVAAVLAVPLTWPPLEWVMAAWAVVIALTVVALLHRLGLTGWRLSLIAAAIIMVVEPVNQTIAFGQVGVFLVALVALDLMPGPRVLPRAPRRWSRDGRWLPIGGLVGVATAIKLTPGLFVVHLLLVRRWRAAIGAVAGFAVLTLLGLLTAPQRSIEFWGRLVHGDTGLGDSVIYLQNQSLFGALTRGLGYGGVGTVLGLAIAALTAVLGVVVAGWWHRRGDEAMAILLCGLATLLASPVSWAHHYVWIVLLAGLLVLRRGWPQWFVVLGWLFVGWAATSPYDFLPSADYVEQDYQWWQHVFSSVTPFLGLALLVAAGVVARPSRGRRDGADHADPPQDQSAV